MFTSKEKITNIDSAIARLAVAYEDGDTELIEAAENAALEEVKKAAWEFHDS